MKRAILLIALLAGALSAARPAMAKPFDQAFIDAMTPHHQQAMMMAQMAAKKARYAEVRRMAAKMMRDQQKEIAQLKAWRKTWYGSADVPMDNVMHTMNGQTMPGMMHGADKMMAPGSMMGLPMKMAMDMAKFRKARGAAVDKMFLQMMMPHHSGAIMMADEALKVTGRSEIRRLSRQIMDKQAKEIGELHRIYHRHFGAF